jgi:hypothetical protein
MEDALRCKRTAAREGGFDRAVRTLLTVVDVCAALDLSSIVLSCVCVLSPLVRSTNANLLPTRPAPKQWSYSGTPEFALLLTPGLGKTCNLKKYPNLQKFLKEDAHF